MTTQLRCKGCNNLIGIVEDEDIVITKHGRKIRIDGFKGAKRITISCEQCKVRNEIRGIDFSPNL